MPNCAEKTPPSKNIPTQPKGEKPKSVRKPIGFVASKAGVGLIDNRIGVIAIDTKIDGMTYAMDEAGYSIVQTFDIRN